MRPVWPYFYGLGLWSAIKTVFFSPKGPFFLALKYRTF